MMLAGKAFSYSYDILSKVSAKALGVCDKLSKHYALRPEDLAHEVSKHRGVCLR